MFRVIMFIVYNYNARAEKSGFPQAKLCLNIRTPAQIPGLFQRYAYCSVVPPNIFDQIFSFKAAVDVSP